MMSTLSIQGRGLVTAVGLDAPTSLAAIQAKVSNPVEMRFADEAGEWLTAHRVPAEPTLRGGARLARMAAMAAQEALVGVPGVHWSRIPLLLCLAEEGRPSDYPRVDDRLIAAIEQDLQAKFAASSSCVPMGRVGMAVALKHARDMLARPDTEHVLLVATDGLIDGATLKHFESQDRLLTSRQSNGFTAGEGAGALLLGRQGGPLATRITGLGFGLEAAHITSGEPLRAEGLTQAVRAALGESGVPLHDVALRIGDLSGEQYYFREAALVLSRLMRQSRDHFDLLHPAECVGEAGALSGVCALVLADELCRTAQLSHPHVLVHVSNDGGQRAAVVLSRGG
jgi:3-oxoacyl-[acyl-carrier-protein] synthase I